jgi:hypothetical protein
MDLKHGDILCGENGEHLAHRAAYPTKDDFLLAMCKHDYQMHGKVQTEPWEEVQWKEMWAIRRYIADMERDTRSVWARFGVFGTMSAPGDHWYETRKADEPKPAKGGWFPAWECGGWI